MRERLTFIFVGVTIAMVLVTIALRALIMDEYMRDHQVEEHTDTARILAIAIAQRQDLRQPIDGEFLEQLVGAEYRLTFRAADGSEVTAVGPHYNRGEPDPELTSSRAVPGGRLVIEESTAAVDRMVSRNLRDGLLLGALITLLAGAIGLVVARLLSEPFQQLAVAAAALGRGRLELDLPRSRIPEVNAISAALGSSARELQQRLHRERDLAEQASHVLRTPLTGLRLEMEELAARSDLPEDARQAADRAVGRVEAMNAVAGEVVRLARGGALVAGAELPLAELVAQATDRWGESFARTGRVLRLPISGDPSTTYTPGPVEQLLDLFLAELLARGDGAAQVALSVGEEGDLRLQVPCPTDESGSSSASVVRARALVAALGGRFREFQDGYDVLLPRR